MKIVFFILFSLSLSANDILTQYRHSGIEGIEKQLDLELAEVRYWDAQLQDIDTSFGYLESYNAILSCDKNSSTLSLFKKNMNNTFVQTKTFSAFTGKLQGDKHVEGDLKTPLGIYNFEQRLDKDNQLDPFYGPLAFVTTYPNLYDKMRGKNGSGIWVHGLPLHQDRDDFTRGCIAIDNLSIESLDENIDINNTVLIINPHSTQEDVSKGIYSAILANLYSWRYSWKYNDLETYISFYTPNFKKSDGMDLEAFTLHKEFVFKKNNAKTILFNDINVFKYPNTDNIYQITFNEYYKTKYFKFEGKKILMIRLDKENKMHIFLEN